MNTIVIGVTGGIAAYKAVELARHLTLQGFVVKVIMTEHATRLVGTPTFRAVTGNEVSCDLFAEGGDAIRHISLAEEADLLIVVPATANILAKMAHGIADDLLSTTLLAAQSPILVAPAMNTWMYKHPATQSNLAELRRRGVQVIGPESGSLACGEKGEGRMAEPLEIAHAALHILGMTESLAEKKVLITAGGTREPIDTVRFIANRSSGKMGYALAEAARLMGAEVILISGPTHLKEPEGVEVIKVETAEEMRQEVISRAPDCVVVVMAAAVADFTTSQVSEKKIKKEGRESLTLELVPTQDILNELNDNRRPGQLVVGFAAETGDLRRKAAEKLRRKGVDLLVANDVSGSKSGFDSDYNQAILLYRDGRELELDLMTKKELAQRIWEVVSALLKGG